MLGGGGGVAFAARQPEVYSSSARILLRPSTGNPYSVETGPSGQQVTIAMTTEAALVESDPVISLVNQRLSPDLLPSNVEASVPANTSTIVATVRAASPALAQQGAQAVAVGYLNYRAGVTSGTREASVNRLNEQIDSVKLNLAQASRAAQDEPADSQSAREAQVFTEQLISLQDLLNFAQSIATDAGTLVTPAAAGARTGIASWLFVAVGLLLGLVVGTSLALWLGRRNTKVHATPGAMLSGVPVLAVFGGPRRGDVEGGDVEGRDRQAFQLLRTSVLASSALPSAVAVSGVGTKDSSSQVALELGRSMNRAGYRVVLVIASAEEAGPFADDVRGARGLADALREGRDATELLVKHDGLLVLSAGAGILQEQELLSGERFGRVLHDLKSDCDYVFVVTGPAVLPAELATARLADAMLLVGRDGTTSRIDIADVVARARLLGLRVSGLVLRARRSRSIKPARKPRSQGLSQERVHDSPPGEADVREYDRDGSLRP